MITNLLTLPQLSMNMNNIQTLSGNGLVSEKVFYKSPALNKNKYLWGNLIIEKSISINWLNKLYKGSVADSFWSVLTSPI